MRGAPPRSCLSIALANALRERSLGRMSRSISENGLVVVRAMGPPSGACVFACVPLPMGRESAGARQTRCQERAQKQPSNPADAQLDLPHERWTLAHEKVCNPSGKEVGHVQAGVYAEFKASAVRLVAEQKYSVREAAKSLGAAALAQVCKMTSAPLPLRSESAGR